MYVAQHCMIESRELWVRVPPEAADFSMKKSSSGVIVLCCIIVKVCLSCTSYIHVCNTCNKEHLCIKDISHAPTYF